MAFFKYIRDCIGSGIYYAAKTVFPARRLLPFARRNGWKRLESICTYFGADYEPIGEETVATREETRLFYNRVWEKAKIIVLAAIQLAFIFTGVPILARLFNDEKTSRDVFLTGTLAILYSIAQGPALRLTQALRRFTPAAFSDANYLKYGELVEKFQKVKGSISHTLALRMEELLNSTEKLFNNPTTKNVAKNEEQIKANLTILEFLFNFVVEPPTISPREILDGDQIAAEADRIYSELEPYLQSLDPDDEKAEDVSDSETTVLNCKFSKRDIFEEEYLEPLLARILNGSKDIIPISNIFLYSQQPSTGKSTLARAVVTAINGDKTQKPKILLFEPELGDYVPPRLSFQPGVDVAFNENLLSIFAQAHIAGIKAGVRDVEVLLDELSDSIGEKFKGDKKVSAKKKSKKEAPKAQVVDDDDDNNSAEDIATMLSGFNKPPTGASLKSTLKTSLNKQIIDIIDRYLGVTINTDDVNMSITTVATGNKPLEPALASRFVTLELTAPNTLVLVAILKEDTKHEIERRKRLRMRVPDIDVNSKEFSEKIRRFIEIRKETHGPVIISRSASQAFIREILGKEEIRPVLVTSSGKITRLGKRAEARIAKRAAAEKYAREKDPATATSPGFY